MSPELQTRHQARIVAVPPTAFDLMLQVTLDSEHMRTSDPALQREADVLQRARRETDEMAALDPDLQLEAELAQPRVADPALDVDLDVYFDYEPDLEVEIDYGDPDLDDVWFGSFDGSKFVAYELEPVTRLHRLGAALRLWPHAHSR